MERIDYKAAGVDPDKAGQIISDFAAFLKTRPKDPNLLSGIGPFASCFSLKSVLSGFEDPVLVTCCDGVGTKAKLALDWNQIEGLGQDLVAMNVNDLLCTGAKPLLFLDYYACGQLREDQLSSLLRSIQHGCEMGECSLAGGETAEMPGLYSGRDFDLAGFSVGLVERSQILGAHRVQIGDRLIAIASSGLHSNGYSLVRKIVEREKINPDEIAPFEMRKWRDVLLAPTTIYVKALASILPRCSAAAHITGGGLFENLPRVLPDSTLARVNAGSWKFPPLFEWLQEKASISTTDLLSTFNCGVGMILAAKVSQTPTILQDLERQSLRAWEIGEVATNTDKTPRVLWA